MQEPNTSRWWAISRDSVLGSEGGGLLARLKTGADGPALTVRLRLTISAPAANAYDVLVSRPCFDLVRVGDP